MKVRDLVENPHLFKSIKIINRHDFYDDNDDYDLVTTKKDILKFLDYEITDITVEKPNYNGPGGTFICIKKPD